MNSASFSSYFSVTTIIVILKQNKCFAQIKIDKKMKFQYLKFRVDLALKLICIGSMFRQEIKMIGHFSEKHFTDFNPIA